MCKAREKDNIPMARRWAESVDLPRRQAGPSLYGQLGGWWWQHLPSAPIGENMNNGVPEEEVEVGVKRKGGRRGDEESPATVHAESSAIAGMYRLQLLLLCHLLM